MEGIKDNLKMGVSNALNALYGYHADEKTLTIQKTRREFSGDFTVVVFPFTRFSRKGPEETGREIGDWLQKHIQEVQSYNVIKGFLNIVLRDELWLDFLNRENGGSFGISHSSNGQQVVLEFSSPNTNKPLHLGHIRNNLLGHSVSRILEANGYDVVRVNLVNDRGIHICKSMLAWMKWGADETPEAAGLKGDQLAGKYYVMFERRYREEMEELKLGGLSEDEAAAGSALMQEARELLRLWEAGDPSVRELWSRMNSWVYEGFDETYDALGIKFDKIYYESDTYLLGKELVHEGVQAGVFEKREDGSVWVDFDDEKLGEKLLLRSDGTSVYITQDLGTAQLRYDEYMPQKLIYVVGNEQNYHFEILTILLELLGRPWASSVYHLSYGMVELPQGRMKSREGKVVDADDLIQEMITTAETTTRELGKADELDDSEAMQLFHTIGLGALKYFILKVDPKKSMLFNPEESIDFNGNTGPFLQYTYARITSLLKKAEMAGSGVVMPSAFKDGFIIPSREREIIRLLFDFEDVVRDAADTLSPALIANYTYELVKEYNHFYQTTPVLKEPDPGLMSLRLQISLFTRNNIRNALYLLGIDVPERM